MALQLPHGRRLAVNIGVDFDAHSAWMGTVGATSPGFLSRGEFDAVVGVPRVLRALSEYGVVGNFFTPTHTMATFPDSFELVLESGHEVSAHGCWHEPIPKLAPDEEQRLLDLQIAQHEKYVGKRPRGYRSPAWDFTDHTLGFLEAAGFEWDSSLMGRDFEPYRPRPIVLDFEAGNQFGPASSVLEFPVSWHLDDFPATEFIPGMNAGMESPETIYQRWKDHLDFAYERVPNGVVSITVHPQAIGRAQYILMFERFLRYASGLDGIWFTNLSALLPHWTD
ncbi:polysaccharide deacetylase [Microbacterium sp. NPDC058389]|uniref:polysaccharide deacetylase family protein n=1 Tax=Microbacterium sp. NPDC058389 TaxID=3346475 RepID=UPI0036563952